VRLVGYCSFIKRTRVGDFYLENAVSIEDATKSDVISSTHFSSIAPSTSLSIPQAIELNPLST